MFPPRTVCRWVLRKHRGLAVRLIMYGLAGLLIGGIAIPAWMWSQWEGISHNDYKQASYEIGDDIWLEGLSYNLWWSQYCCNNMRGPGRSTVKLATFPRKAGKPRPPIWAASFSPDHYEPPACYTVVGWPLREAGMWERTTNDSRGVAHVVDRGPIILPFAIVINASVVAIGLGSIIESVVLARRDYPQSPGDRPKP